MKKLLIFVFVLFTLFPLSSQNQLPDVEMISLVYETINSSISRLKKMGKPGKEEICGLVSGQLRYSTVLTGFNKVENILEYIEFCDFNITLTGSQISDVNWGGSGTSYSEFILTGIDELTMIMEFDLKRKIPVGGRYLIIRDGEDPREYPYDILGN